MAVDLKALGLDKLSLSEKRELAETLLEEVDAAAEIPPGYELTDAQRAELDRRIADAEANPDDYVLWEDVLAESRRKYGYGS